MARPREITDEQLTFMRARLAEGMPYTEVASIIGRSEFFVRKYCRGESHWTPTMSGSWAAVTRSLKGDR